MKMYDHTSVWWVFRNEILKRFVSVHIKRSLLIEARIYCKRNSQNIVHNHITGFQTKARSKAMEHKMSALC